MTNKIDRYEECKPMIYKMMSQYKVNNNDKEDFLQAGFEGVSQAISTFDNTRNTKFTSWAYFTIRKQIQKQKNLQYSTHLSSSSRTDIKHKEITTPIINVDIPDTDVLSNPIATISLKERIVDLNTNLYKLNKKFSEIDTNIFIDYYLQGFTLKELKTKYKIPYTLINSKLNSMVRLAKCSIKEKSKCL